MTLIQPKYKVVSLFSGAGGLDAGMERTGRFETIAFVENQASFAATLQANVDAGSLGAPGARVLTADMSELDPYELMDELGLEPGQIDVLAGGPPCQTFSTAGRRGTVQDRRGLLLWDFSRFIEAFQPRYFVMENVRGLLSAGLKHRPIKDRPSRGGAPLEADEEPGSVVARWAADLFGANENRYRVDCFEVNAANYGAPQIRERVLFIGNRLGHLTDFPRPTHGPKAAAAPAELFDAVKTPPFRTLGEALDTMVFDDGEILDFSPRKKRFLAQVPEGGNWRTLPVHVQQESMGKAWYAKGGRSGWWRRLSRDLPSPTIVTLPNHASTAMCHPTETRALTLRECAAVQEFPNDWIFCGTTGQRYTQVGNALPLRLAEVAAEVVADGLERPTDGRSHPPYRKVYVDSHLRTRQWFRNGEAVVWEEGGSNAHAAYSAAGRRT